MLYATLQWVLQTQQMNEISRDLSLRWVSLGYLTYIHTATAQGFTKPTTEFDKSPKLFLSLLVLSIIEDGRSLCHWWVFQTQIRSGIGMVNRCRYIANYLLSLTVAAGWPDPQCVATLSYLRWQPLGGWYGRCGVAAGTTASLPHPWPRVM